MSHVKNIEAFSQLVNFCTGYGGLYNPSSPSLQIPALLTQLQQARHALERVMIAKAKVDNEVNHRKQVFSRLSRLAASILRMLEASGAAREKIEDARGFVRQLTGSLPKHRVPVQSVQPPIYRSRLQLAYVSRTDSFSNLVEAVVTEPLYQPNEPMLSRESLTEKLAELNALNSSVSHARVTWSNTLITRNGILYQHSLSLYQTARSVRKYIRAIYGHDSEEFAQVKGLRFIKPDL